MSAILSLSIAGCNNDFRFVANENRPIILRGPALFPFALPRLPVTLECPSQFSVHCEAVMDRCLLPCLLALVAGVALPDAARCQDSASLGKPQGLAVPPRLDCYGDPLPAGAVARL